MANDIDLRTLEAGFRSGARYAWTIAVLVVVLIQMSAILLTGDWAEEDRGGLLATMLVIAMVIAAPIFFLTYYFVLLRKVPGVKDLIVSETVDGGGTTYELRVTGEPGFAELVRRFIRIRSIAQTIIFGLVATPILIVGILFYERFFGG